MFANKKCVASKDTGHLIRSENPRGIDKYLVDPYAKLKPGDIIRYKVSECFEEWLVFFDSYYGKLHAINFASTQKEWASQGRVAHAIGRDNEPWKAPGLSIELTGWLSQAGALKRGWAFSAEIDEAAEVIAIMTDKLGSAVVIGDNARIVHVRADAVVERVVLQSEW